MSAEGLEPHARHVLSLLFVLSACGSRTGLDALSNEGVTSEAGAADAGVDAAPGMDSSSDASAEPAPDSATPLGALSITAGGYDVCAVMTDHTARCWGIDLNDQFGDGSTASRLSPGAIPASQVAQVSVSQGVLWVRGQDGVVRSPSRYASDVPPPPFDDVVDISVGDTSMSCAVRAAGTVWCSGFLPSDSGKPTCATVGGGPSPATQVPGLDGVTRVSVGSRHACALRSDGSVRCWGDNQFGELGDGTQVCSATPVAVTGIGDVVQVVASSATSCARTGAGEIWCWGQSWDATAPPSSSPRRLDGFHRAIDLGVGDGTICTVDSSHQVWCVGNVGWYTNGSGCSGSVQSTPAPVSGLDGVVQIASCYTDVCARKADGTVWCWGCNENGEVGNGTTMSQGPPVQVLP